MITGIVLAGREAVIRVPVRGLHGQESTVEAIIDTGFTDFLMLPTPLVATLALPRVATVPVVLADGSEADTGLFEGTVIWDNLGRQITILATGGDPLVGMSMLLGYRVTLDVEDGGPVLIDALP